MGDIPVDHIKVGNFLWYSGETMFSAWDCPCEIIEVNEEERWFRVRSLDDMREQDQRYSFEVSDHSPTSRKSMYVPKPKAVVSYVASRKNGLSQSIDDAQINLFELRKEQQAMAEFYHRLMEKL